MSLDAARPYAKVKITFLTYFLLLYELRQRRLVTGNLLCGLVLEMLKLVHDGVARFEQASIVDMSTLQPS